MFDVCWWWAGAVFGVLGWLDRAAGPGGAACRLLAALRGRPVQIVTSAGKYVVTKFPLMPSLIRNLGSLIFALFLEQ